MSNQSNLIASLVIVIVLVGTLLAGAITQIFASADALPRVCALTPETSGIEGSGENGDAVQGVAGNTEYPIYSAFSSGSGGGHILRKDSASANWVTAKTNTPLHQTSSADMRPTSIWASSANDIWVGLQPQHPGEITDNPTGPNLVANPGFETYTTTPGIPDSWSQYGGATGITWTKETTMVDSGLNAARLSVDWATAGTGGKGIQQIVTPTADTYYTFHGKYYLPNAIDAGTSIGVQVRDDTLGVTIVRNAINGVVGTWSESITGWKAVAGHTYYVQTQLFRGGASGATESVIFDSLNMQVQDSLAIRAFQHWDGVTWSTVNLYDINDERTDFATFPQFASIVDVRGIWGTAANDIWMVDNGNMGRNAVGVDHLFEQRIWHYDGVSWSSVTHPAAYELITVYGFSTTDVWVVGGERATQAAGFVDVAEILHYDGVSWSDVTPPTGITKLEHLWGSGPNDLWAAGGDTNAGQIIHWNGIEWEDYTSLIPVSPVPAIRGISGTHADSVYFVGSSGLVLHWNGIGFEQVVSATSTNLREVSNFEDIYIVGNDGLILHYICSLSTTNRAVMNLWMLLPMLALLGIMIAIISQTWKVKE